MQAGPPAQANKNLPENECRNLHLNNKKEPRSCVPDHGSFLWWGWESNHPHPPNNGKMEIFNGNPLMEICTRRLMEIL